VLIGYIAKLIFSSAAMDTSLIRQPFSNFESITQNVYGIECWRARELQRLLGYSKWSNLLTVIDKAKDLAAEMTNVNVTDKDLKGMKPIADEHIQNNLAVRKALGERGIVPEKLPPAEDLQKVKRTLEREDKKVLQTMKKVRGTKKGKKGE